MSGFARVSFGDNTLDLEVARISFTGSPYAGEPADFIAPFMG